MTDFFHMVCQENKGQDNGLLEIGGDLNSKDKIVGGGNIKDEKVGCSKSKI